LAKIACCHGFRTLTHRGALLSTLLHAILPLTFHLLNVFLQIANTLGFHKKKKWKPSNMSTSTQGFDIFIRFTSVISKFLTAEEKLRLNGYNAYLAFLTLFVRKSALSPVIITETSSEFPQTWVSAGKISR
jgi:hypothetical protein